VFGGQGSGQHKCPPRYNRRRGSSLEILLSSARPEGLCCQDCARQEETLCSCWGRAAEGNGRDPIKASSTTASADRRVERWTTLSRITDRPPDHRPGSTFGLQCSNPRREPPDPQPDPHQNPTNPLRVHTEMDASCYYTLQRQRQQWRQVKGG